MTRHPHLRVPKQALGLLALLASVAACTTASPAPADAVVTFAFTGYPADTLRVHVTRARVIDHVREILAGSRPPLMPIGPIRRGAGIDPRYPFHFLPDEIDLAPLAIELCDGAPMHTLAEVEAFIAGATGSPDAQTATWCPWGAYPIDLDEQGTTDGLAR